MKSVGIIGGLGPETTAEFYLEIIFQCQKRNQEQRPLIIVASVPLPFEIEQALIAKNEGKERYIPYLTAEAKRLQASGADFIVMPCNSLHAFINEIRAAVSVPVLSIVEATIAYVQDHQYQVVGLISTSATVENRVYESEFSEAGIAFTIPDGLQRAQMDKIIQHLVGGRHSNVDREQIQAIVDGLATNGVDCVALACTDLQLLMPSSNTIPVFDTMKLLANRTVNEILS